MEEERKEAMTNKAGRPSSTPQPNGKSDFTYSFATRFPTRFYHLQLNCMGPQEGHGTARHGVCHWLTLFNASDSYV
jgi:hypothetical protein